MKSQVLCVLGMHRSGTSCLTGTLEEAGVYLGEVFRKNQHNAKGNRENRQIMELHEALLVANGGSWDDPPEKVRWAPEHKAAQRAIIASYAGQPVWGFKDPRVLFNLDGWLEELPHMSLLGIYRHPLAVARSLFNRNQFPLDKGVKLWERYNRRLLAYHARYRFPMLTFDADEQRLRVDMAAVLARLGLAVPANQFTFFDASLRHAEAADDVPLDASARSLYESLRRAG